MFSATIWYTNYSMEIILFVSKYLSGEIIMLTFIILEYHHTEIKILANFLVSIPLHLPRKGVGEYSLC